MVDKSNPKALEEHLAFIKERLVAFSHRKPHGAELEAEMRKVIFEGLEGDLEAQLIMTQDEFTHCRRLHCSNRRILDHFIETDKLLSEEDRRNLDGFRDYHVALLKVLEHREHSMLVRNLMNGWQGEVRANMGIETLAEHAPVDSYVMTALVYFGDDMWVSGCQTPIEASQGEEVLEMAISMASETPSLMVRGNRERERAGFALQDEQHRTFVEYFGHDFVLCTPNDIDSLMLEFQQFRMADIKDLELPKIELPEAFADVEEMSVFCTPEEGFTLDIASTSIIRALKAENLKGVLKQGKQLRRLITSSHVTPTSIRSMARNFPELFGAAVKQVFSFRTFDPTKNLEPLLFKYKGMGAEPPRNPTLSAIGMDDPIFRALYGERD